MMRCRTLVPNAIAKSTKNAVIIIRRIRKVLWCEKSAKTVPYPDSTQRLGQEPISINIVSLGELPSQAA
ncbi:hypothetical protein ANO14919_002990 [Xylariales sp. No.14919]|nr:hypothetical protein ANO14919_002990 [Xylariales sp. No.14919]